MQKEQIRPFGWGIVAGMVALLALLFATDWMVTSSAAATAARESANTAMVDNLAPICVFQFNADPEKATLLEELKKVSGWRQYEFVQKQGWATMPGSDNWDSDVARECVARIIDANK